MVFLSLHTIDIILDHKQHGVYLYKKQIQGNKFCLFSGLKMWAKISDISENAKITAPISHRI